MRTSFFLLAALWCASAGAQIKPKILIVFDTSGSMLQNSSGQWQDGDGSALCTNLGQSSRIYQLKTALFDALQGMGAQEVDFGLGTFPMFVDPTRAPYCAIGAQSCSTNSNCRPGETCSQVLTGACPTLSCPTGETCILYQGQLVCLGQACITPCQTQPSCSGHYYTGQGTMSELCVTSTNTHCYYGCKVSGHTPTTQQNASCGDASNPCSAWYTTMKQEVLKVGFGSPPESVMWYFDQQEDTDQLAPLANPEVRSGDGWWTPLGKSLFYAHGYFHKEVVPSIPAYEKPCTNLAVAMFTDGDETCNETPTDPFYPTKWATALNTNLGVVTHTVAIDTTSSLLQGIALAGKGGYYNVQANSAALKQAFLDIIAKSLPPVEICDGKDNDCDAKIDEDFPLKGTPCNNGKPGLCYKTGVYVCNTAGTGVVCNAPAASGTAEICNGIDDNCNGVIDDVSKSCTQDADCASLGQASCVSSQCVCQICVPQPEICNGKDDDCDGQVDEDFVPQPCGKDLGECKPGQTKCVSGAIVCDGGSGPQTEVCNGLDDDCDGTRDGMTDACYTHSSGCTQDPTTQQWTCLGYCKVGMKTCTAVQAGGSWSGVWSGCVGQVGPGLEICNGQDDNCDGQVDETAECPGESVCVGGQCTSPCGAGEFICPKGQICKDDWCIPDPCDSTTCGAQGGVCKAGQCINPCDGKQCGKYETCDKGVCIDTSCYNPKHACPPGELCLQGLCVDDPCLDVTCTGDAFCSGGTCVQLCDSMTCAAGETCEVVQQAGKPVAQCVKDPCAGQSCQSPYTCIDGTCVLDPCDARACETGEVCIGGNCIADPCETVVCPRGYGCAQGMCVGGSDLQDRSLLATGAGGLACAMARPGQPTGPLPTFPLLLILVLSFIIRQSRRD